MTDSIRSWAIFVRAGALCGATVFATHSGACRLWPECTGRLSACLGDRKATFQGQRSAPARPSAAIGGASVIRPGAYLTYDAFPFSPLFGYPAVNLGFPQPLGHQIISYGAAGTSIGP